MKTIKTMSIAIVVLLAILASTAGTFPGSKEKSKSAKPAPGSELAVPGSAETIPSTAEAEEGNQCGVSESQIISYLQNCSHQHTVQWLQDVPGTCNTRAGVGSGIVATVYVSEGIIVGHQDNQVSGGGGGGESSSSRGR